MEPSQLQALREDAADDDDALRLRWAQRFQDAGDPARAELVRVQCALARTHFASAEVLRLKARSKELLAAHAERWEEGLEHPTLAPGWHRGFIETLEIELTTPAGVLDFAFARAPIRQLIVAGEAHDRGPAAFLASTALTSVRSLNLGEAERSVEQLAQLLTTGAWTSLEELELGDEPDVPAAVGAALGAGLPALRRLAVFGYMSATGGDVAARELAASAVTNQLHTLELWNTELGPAGARALAESSRLEGLHTLRLGGGHYSTNRIGAEGAAALASSRHLAGLHELHLAANAIGDEGAMALGRAAPLRSLRVLNLRHNELHHDGLKHLLVSDLLDSVQTLDLSLNSLEDRAVETLVVSDPGELHTLWLRGNPLSDRSARVLAAAPLGGRLRSLHLGGTGIGDAGALSLLPLAQSDDLVRLFLDQLSLQEDTREQLREAFGERVAL